MLAVVDGLVGAGYFPRRRPAPEQGTPLQQFHGEAGGAERRGRGQSGESAADDENVRFIHRVMSITAP